MAVNTNDQLDEIFCTSEILTDADTGGFILPTGSNTPSSIFASLTDGLLIYTAVKAGNSGNNISINYISGGIASLEVVTVVGNAITVKIQSGVSTGAQIAAAIHASPAASALVTVPFPLIDATTRTIMSVTPLTGAGQKPDASSAYNGLLRYNTTTNLIEAVINGNYQTVATSTSITGFVHIAGDTMTGTLQVVGGIIIATSPNSGTMGAVQIRDAIGNPNLAILQFTNNAGSVEYSHLTATSAGFISTNLTPPPGDSTLKLATTAFVGNAVATAITTVSATVATAVATAVASASPAGTIIMYGGSTAPTGYLECNGQSTSGYTALAAVVGATVPDLRGLFVRGWDHGRGIDPGRGINTYQADMVHAHKHQQGNGWEEFNGGPFGQTSNAGHIGSNTGYDTNQAAFYTNDGSNFQNGDGFVMNPTGVIGGETRPQNIALMYCIKF